MQTMDELEAWVIRPDGTVELKSAGAANPPAFTPRLGDPAAPCRIETDESVLLLCRLVPRDALTADRLLVLRRPRPRSSDLDRLTPRQREVCELAAAGATVPEISVYCAISTHTVRTHLKSAYRRLAVSNRVELARVLA